MKKVMFVYNPKAGKESALDYKDKIVNKLKEDFDYVIVRETEKRGSGIEFAQEASDNKYDAVCVYGGDGTINEILNGLKDKECVPGLRILPGGTGNILTQMIHIPQNMDEAIENLSFEKIKEVDLGVVNDEYTFSLFFSLGTVSEAIHNVSNEEKANLGFFAYIRDTFLGLLDRKNYKLKITTEDMEYEGNVNHLLISLSNKVSFLKYSDVGKNMGSGKANIYILTESNRLSRLSAASNALLGKIEEDDNVTYLSGSNIKIELMEDIEIETDVDGDKGPKLPVDIKILKKKIKLFLPKNYIE